MPPSPDLGGNGVGTEPRTDLQGHWLFGLPYCGTPVATERSHSASSHPQLPLSPHECVSWSRRDGVPENTCFGSGIPGEPLIHQELHSSTVCSRLPQRRYCGYLRSSLAYRLILSLTACKTSGMNRSFSRLSAKEELILDMLISEGQMYGLEMVRASDNQLKRGTVYVTLGRMTGRAMSNR